MVQLLHHSCFPILLNLVDHPVEGIELQAESDPVIPWSILKNGSDVRKQDLLYRLCDLARMDLSLSLDAQLLLSGGSELIETSRIENLLGPDVALTLSPQAFGSLQHQSWFSENFTPGTPGYLGKSPVLVSLVVPPGMISVLEGRPLARLGMICHNATDAKALGFLFKASLCVKNPRPPRMFTLQA